LKHIRIRHVRFFELFPIIFGVVIVWVCATILTVTGAYDHASALGQLHCHTDQSGLDSHAPWYYIPSIIIYMNTLLEMRTVSSLLKEEQM
jgi:nucleobase transporter 1/2